MYVRSPAESRPSPRSGDLTSTPKRVLVIGIDGATWTVLQPLMDMGRMPHLSRLCDDGVRSVLRSTSNPVTPCAWTSLATGFTEARHGITDFVYFDTEQYRIVPYTAQERVKAPLWRWLNQCGYRVGILNLPWTAPVQPLDGFIVAGLGVADNEHPDCYPPSLLSEIKAIAGQYATYASPSAGIEYAPAGVVRRYCAQIEDLLSARTQVALALQSRFHPHFMLVQFQSLDAIQHSFWKCLVGSDARRRPELRAELLKPYTAMDEAIGRLTEAADSDTLVMVVSDHGFWEMEFVVSPNLLLRQWGYLELSARGRRQLRRRRILSLLRPTVRLAYAMPTAVADSIFSIARAIAMGTEVVHFTADVVRYFDLSKTQAFCPLGYHQGQIFINLQGRSPGGIVASEHFASLCRELQQKFRSVLLPDGRPAFDSVLYGPDVYPHIAASRRADLILVPNEGVLVLERLGYGPITSCQKRTAGIHHPDGVLVLSGPGVQKASPLDTPRLVDIAPTVLHYMGCPVPEDMEGRVLEELLAEGLAVRKVPASALETSPQEVEQPLTDEDERAIMERLRQLGYLG
jgi:predicted AlkP superfamily phosphohydrolase/phosphomutase